MTVRVALAAAAIMLAGSAAHADYWLIREPVFACKRNVDTRAITDLYKSSPEAAGRTAEKKGCEVLPPGLRVTLVDADSATLTACVIQMGDKACSWIPARKTILVEE